MVIVWKVLPGFPFLVYKGVSKVQVCGRAPMSIIYSAANIVFILFFCNISDNCITQVSSTDTVLDSRISCHKAGTTCVCRAAIRNSGSQ